MRVGMELADRYRLEEPLGRGGMGEVWRGTDRRLGREVAVKLLPLAAAADKAAVARFRREAEIAATLNHPGITTVFDIDEYRRGDHHLLFLVMELMRGRDLAAVLAEHPGGLPIARVKDWAIQVVDALAEAHRQGVVHRDIKPANLFLVSGGRVKICDFGIARLADATRLTATGGSAGTPLYMPPEQIQGRAVDHRTDLYSFGCVLYELLTGASWLDTDGGLAAILYQQLEQLPAPPKSVRPDVPDALNTLVLECLAKNPDARPKDATAVGERLRCLPDRAHPAQGGQLPAPAVPGVPALAMPAGAHAPGGPAGAPAGPPPGAWMPPSPPPQGQPRMPQAPGSGGVPGAPARASTPPGAARDRIGRRAVLFGGLGAVATAVTGAGVVHLLSDNDGDRGSGGNAAADGVTAVRTATLTTARPVAMAFSPDSRTLAVCQGRAVRMWDVATAENTVALEGHPRSVTTVAFSPDGRMVATGSIDGTARLWDVATGKSTGVLKHGAGAVAVAFSPDGKKLATSGTDGSARLWSTRETGRPNATFRHGGSISAVAFGSSGESLITVSLDPGGVGSVWTWDIADGNSVVALNDVLPIGLSPDGKTLASADRGGVVLREVQPGGGTRATLNGHSGAVNAVAFSRDGETLVTGGTDKTARLWKTATGAGIATLTGHTGPVGAVAISPDGTVATGDPQQPVSLWKIR
ncbi:WD40 repeat domain-containing serine/threonine protein kinase [Spirillospora sp. CA-255316]